MRTSVRAVLAAATATVAALAVAGAPAEARHRSEQPVRVLATGLSNPFGIEKVGHDSFVVAENDSGEVTLTGRRGNRPLLSGVPGVSGVAAYGSHVYAVLGGPNEEGAPPTGDFPPSALVRLDRSGHATQIADLLAYELAHNPDGQVQEVDGQPVEDALSNPFSMTATPFGLLVADGGANDVLRVDPRTGRVSTFFVPPTVTDVPACLEPGSQANPGTVGCDPVPTGVAWVGRSVYVSTLGGDLAGASKIYRLDARTGRVLAVWGGFSGLTGVAASPRGDVYASQVFYGAPEGDPGPDFDPSTVGRIVKISCDGRQSSLPVTMPTGLDYENGRLYATAWSVAGLLGIPEAGQVVEVDTRAFS